ncbi:hypothetical protein BVC80_881g75 [Macleaya cordata]|uniref:Stress response protein NST1 n=1 Tax=Macleaya cordata TaxID=56857 RepID=A0A200RDD2_MACCD|nr:hypothetical protein BVC80_881g75 [Macleaya cordata]
MPGLPQRNAQFSEVSSLPYSSACSAGPVSTNAIWSKHRNEITFDQLQKFWNELPPHARKELLRIDKQTLFEQARKNLYCSRCNGLLLEGFSHIVMYGKSLQQEGGAAMHIPAGRPGTLKNDGSVNSTHLSCQDDIQDPFIHPWGGLAATRDGILTLLDCFLDAKSLKALQNVFDSARMRERQRKLLYPDACGGGGRGWISQGITNYGRGHGTREACALHTARLSCETLLGFWSALGDETQQSLLRMKEEDFIERLMYRFESKRFCRDCRRNVIREFKELKELKRIRRETRCTIWFCVADVAFDYEVSDSTVQADWRQSFTDTVGTYQHFEWAVGTGEGKSDILEFEDVGMNRRVQVTGLDLGGLTACFITLRAWKLDGRCTELSVKAHALKGQPCVHRRLLVGDGFVTITEGECIGRFFEQAEEAEEEEDDDSMDKDGNELDGEGSRLQKHAKSPELAREFLLDAAIVIFKEQVEKAFREGTARQNAHSIFVCLALKLLEERIHVACKEIITLEKQIKLLEEEEKEKREEGERKERRKAKDREKKLRRKERLKGKDKEIENKCVELEQASTVPEISSEKSSPDIKEELYNTVNSEDSLSESGDVVLDSPLSPDIQEEQSSDLCITSKMQNVGDDCGQNSCSVANRKLNARDVNGSSTIEQSKSSHCKLRFRKEYQVDSGSKWSGRSRSLVDDESGDMRDEFEPRLHGGCTATSSRCINGVYRQSRSYPMKSSARICGPKYGEKFYCSNYRVRDRYDFKACGCNLQNDYRTKDGQNSPIIVSDREIKTKSESASDVSRPLYRKSKYTNGFYSPDSYRTPKNKLVTGKTPNRDFVHTKKVWYPRSNSDSDITLRSSTSKVDVCEEGRTDGTGSQQADNLLKSGDQSLYELSKNSGNSCGLNNHQNQEDPHAKESRNSSPITDDGCLTVSALGANSPSSSRKGTSPTTSNTSNSNNCSSYLTEADSNGIYSSVQNKESLSISDSENGSQQSEGRVSSTFHYNESQKCLGSGEWNSLPSKTTTGNPDAGCVVQNNFEGDPPRRNVHNPDNDRIMDNTNSQPPHCLPQSMHSQGISFPVFPAPSAMAYYHQRPASWSATPANGLMSFPQPSCFLLPSPLGYGLSENQPSHFCMQYSAIQPVINLLDLGQLPAYQVVNKASSVTSAEQTKNSNLGGARESINGPDRRRAPSCQEAPLASNEDGKNFSLFHFGGPISVATGNDLSAGSLKEGLVGDTFSNSPVVPSRPGFDCSGKEMTGEEYSLFAASNRTSFSFF